MIQFAMQPRVQARKLRVALKSAEAAHFGKPRIVIDANLQIRIASRPAFEVELIGEPEHARIAATLDRNEMQVTIRSNMRDGRGGNRS